MLSNSWDFTFYQNVANPNVLTKANPVVIEGKEAITHFFTHYGHLPEKSLAYGGNNTDEYWCVLSISERIGKACTDLWLEGFKTCTKEDSEQTRDLLDQMRLQYPRFVDFSKPIWEWEGSVDSAQQQCNIVASVQMMIPFILRCSTKQKAVEYIQNYHLWISRCIDMSGDVTWVDSDKRLYRHREINDFRGTVIQIWDRSGLYKAYLELFNEAFPDTKPYYG